MAIGAALAAGVVLLRILELRRLLGRTPGGIFLPGDSETSTSLIDNGLEPGLVKYALRCSVTISSVTYTLAPQVASRLPQRTLGAPSLCEPELKHDMFKL